MEDELPQVPFEEDFGDEILYLEIKLKERGYDTSKMNLAQLFEAAEDEGLV